MILADKIIDLRKKERMSQEELADKLNVSRQSVSKWESNQSIPELDKILLMSDLFNVTTDALLKDNVELGNMSTLENTKDDSTNLTIEQAKEFLEVRKGTTFPAATAGALAMFSIVPVGCILYGGMYLGKFDAALSIFLGLLSFIVILVVSLIILINVFVKLRKFNYLKEPFKASTAVIDLAQKIKLEREDKNKRLSIIGVLVFIIGIIPLISIPFLAYRLSIDMIPFLFYSIVFMLVLCSCGIFTMIFVMFNKSGYNVLLQEKEFSIEQKKKKKIRFIEVLCILYLPLMILTGAIAVLLTKDVMYFLLVYSILGLFYAFLLSVLNGFKLI